MYIRAGSVAAAAYELGISETTVRQHLSGLCRRTGCLNAAQAAYWLGTGRLAARAPARGRPTRCLGVPTRRSAVVTGHFAHRSAGDRNRGWRDRSSAGVRRHRHRGRTRTVASPVTTQRRHPRTASGATSEAMEGHRVIRKTGLDRVSPAGGPKRRWDVRGASRVWRPPAAWTSRSCVAKLRGKSEASGRTGLVATARLSGPGRRQPPSTDA